MKSFRRVLSDSKLKSSAYCSLTMTSEFIKLYKTYQLKVYQLYEVARCRWSGAILVTFFRPGHSVPDYYPSYSFHLQNQEKRLKVLNICAFICL